MVFVLVDLHHQTLPFYRASGTATDSAATALTSQVAAATTEKLKQLKSGHLACR